MTREYNTATGKQDIMFVSTDKEINMGRRIAEGIETNPDITLDPDPLMTERVKKIGNRIASVSDRKEVNYTFRVIDKDKVNAFALPGGYIFVFRGLVESAGLEGFLSKQFYVKANVHKLNISDEDISFMLADASANGSGKDTVLIDLFRRVVGGRPPILSGSNASLSAYLEGWKQNQEALKEQVRADMDAGLPWYQKIGGKDPVL